MRFTNPAQAMGVSFYALTAAVLTTWMLVGCGSHVASTDDLCVDIVSKVAKCVSASAAETDSAIASCKTACAGGAPACAAALQITATCVNGASCTELLTSNNVCDENAPNVASACTQTATPVGSKAASKEGSKAAVILRGLLQSS